MSSTQRNRASTFYSTEDPVVEVFLRPPPTGTFESLITIDNLALGTTRDAGIFIDNEQNLESLGSIKMDLVPGAPSSTAIWARNDTVGENLYFNGESMTKPPLYFDYITAEVLFNQEFTDITKGLPINPDITPHVYTGFLLPHNASISTFEVRFINALNVGTWTFYLEIDQGILESAMILTGGATTGIVPINSSIAKGSYVNIIAEPGVTTNANQSIMYRLNGFYLPKYF